ncbi:hypothetical protein [Sphingomonas psychrotolerans]|uniref:Uncharacterized protein n=1 Tax=Sphingomonas psychrotolerans TaxID=1327635 RepID=A0A2K8MF47_9SPHN|nr:hypothetical protein [Sphingomonas psychrotolerans]ATY31156.1 hypothetical protein CVN68_03475 [Sphingomonas psychrotolerans]
MSPLRIALALTSIATSASIARAQVTPSPHIGTGKLAPGVTIPDWNVVLRLPSVELERKEVFDWVDRDLTLAMPQFWSRPVRDIARNYSKSALAVERVRSRVGSACAPFYDRIDLTMVRLRRFRLVGYNIEPLPPRYGQVQTSPAEAIAVNTRVGDVFSASLMDANQIRIRPPLFVKQEGALNTCWSGYWLTVTLEGPKGASPFGDYRRPSHRDSR